MTGESRHACTIKGSDTGSTPKDKGALGDQFGGKAKKEARGHQESGSVELPANSGAKFSGKDREPTQREAVIRPQQAGKIDFKSLQNQSKFSDDRIWPNGKGNPQSPAGKKAREKSKKSGKVERSSPQQLYRLSITNPRSNPTIGIAYPQQKVTPPKKVDVGRGGPVSGSYRFHVPSIPEREAELQQQDLNYNRSFLEAPTNYTSQTAGASGSAPAHQLTATPPQPGPLENSGAQPGSQLFLPEFTVNGTSSWLAPEKTFNGANYGVSSHKQNVFAEGNKRSANFVPLQFHYEYLSLQDAATDPFPDDQCSHSQDYMDVSLAGTQVTHSSFIHSSVEGQENLQTNSQFNHERPEGRPSFSQPLQPAEYLQSPHGVQFSMHCYKDRSEHSLDSEGTVSGCKQLEHNDNLPDNTATFSQEDNGGVTHSPVNKICPPKDGASNPRPLVEGNTHHTRSISQGPESQMHFPSKPYSISVVNTIHMGSVPFDSKVPTGNVKTHSRLPKTWEGSGKAEKLQFSCQPPVEQSQYAPKNRKMPWQQIHFTSITPNQNRTELSRELSNQKLTFPTATSSWQDANNLQKSGPQNGPSGFHNRKPSEGFVDSRQGAIKLNCNTTPVFLLDSGVEPSTSQSRSKPLYFGLKKSLPRTNSQPPSQVPPVGLMSVTSCGSPLSSPIQNTASSSTCSSLSTSPVNISSEDSQRSMVGPTSTFYHQHQGKLLLASDNLNADIRCFHPDISRTYPYPSDRAKEVTLTYPLNTKYKSTIDSGKGYINNFAIEQHPPPPYSAHQLLASSLAAANLDQLDVLLTCKQCDQNFSNLTSFLDHKQYCGQNVLAQSNEFKDVPRLEETKNLQPDSTKTSLSGPNISLPRCPSELHLSLLGLNKNDEVLSDGEMKVDSKDDPLKFNLFAGSGTLPVSLPDLEMDDAKLDSLITEALNGLGYQSDNAEIDSSFIDAFADDEFNTAKVTGSGKTTKNKDPMMSDSRSKHANAGEERSQPQGKCLYDTLNAKNRNTTNVRERSSPDFKQVENNSIKEGTARSIEQFETIKEGGCSRDNHEVENKKDSQCLLSRKFSERCGLKSLQDSHSTIKLAIPRVSTNRNSAAQNAGAKGKRRKAGGGTWSKELIHKIVQQKNKLHKLHVKGTKNLQFSLAMDKLTPGVQNPKFGEYEYVSESDEDSEPLKIASQGCLGHRGRNKYSREYKGRDKDNEKPNTLNGKTKESLKMAVEASPSLTKQSSSCQVRRRNSRSSTCSENSGSNSVSSESTYSPKSIDRTDSDGEKRPAVKRTSVALLESCAQEGYERSKLEVPKEPSAASSHPLPKTAKRYGSAKFLLSANPNSSKRGRDGLSDFSIVTKSLPELNSTIVTFQEKEQLCTAGPGIEATEWSELSKEDRKCNKSVKAYVQEFQYAGTHSKLPPVEVIPDTNCTDYKNDCSRKKKAEVSERKKSEYKRSPNAPRLHDYSAILKSGAETPVCLNEKQIDYFECETDPKTTMICSVEEMQGTSARKDTAGHISLPYSIEPDENPIKSPLSFDTSSMFSDLTVPGFDSSLYSDIPMSNEAFNALGARNDKRELFDSSFTPYLREKDWSLIADVPPIIPDDNSELKDLSDKAISKNTNPGHFQLTLPDKLMEHNPNGNNTEDELEIKRIVTELENKLQTSKQNHISLLDSEISKQLTSSKFSPLQQDHKQSSMPVGDDVACATTSAPSTVTHNIHELVESSTDPNASWSSPFQFMLQEGQCTLHSPINAGHSTLGLCAKNQTESVEGRGPQPPLSHKTEDAEVIKSSSTDKSEEMAEHELYTQNLMKCLEVISDSVLKKQPLTADRDSNLSPFLHPNQSVQDKQGDEEHQRVIQFIPIDEFKSPKSEKNEALLLPFDNCNSAKGGHSQSNKSPAFSTVLCKDMPVREDANDIDETQIKVKIHEKDSEKNEPQSIKENCILPKAFDRHQLEEACKDVSKDKEPVPQQQDLFSASAFQYNEEEQDKRPSTILPISKSSIDQSEVRRNNTKLNLKKFTEDKHEDSDDSGGTCSYSAYEKLEVSAGSVKEEISIDRCDLLEPDSIKQTEMQQDALIDTQFESEEISTHTAVSLDREMTPDVPCSPLPVRTVSEMAEDGSILLKNTPVTSEHGHIQKEALSDLKTSLHSAGTILRDEEKCNSPGTVVSLSPQNNLLLPAEDPDGIHENHHQSIWNDFERLSPIGEKLSELDSSGMHLCDAPVPLSPEMSGLLVNLPCIDPKDSGPPALTLISALEHTDSLMISQETLKEDLLGPLLNDQKLDPLYELKPNIQNYKEISDLSPHLEEFRKMTGSLNESMDNEAVLLKGPKDNCDNWQLNLDRPLTYNSPVNSIHQISGDGDTLPAASNISMGLCSFDITHDIQSNTKCSCTRPPSPNCKESSTLTINRGALEFNSSMEKNIHSFDISPSPLKTVDYMDLHIGLLKEADIENINRNSSQPQPGTSLLSPTESDEGETFEPPSQHAEVVSGLLSRQTELHKVKEDGCKENQADERTSDSWNKSTVLKKNSKQELIPCEICSSCFRTLPGLKRHKAMKHLPRKEHINQENVITYQGHIAFYGNSHFLESGHKDPELLNPQVYLRMDNQLSSEDNESYRVSEDDTNCIHGGINNTGEANKLITPKNKDKQIGSTPVTKVAKKCEVQKSIMMDKKDARNFDDEQLTMLKTDILQAIAPDFPTASQTFCQKKIEKQDKLKIIECLEMEKPESLPFNQTCISRKQEIESTDRESPRLHNQCDETCQRETVETEPGKSSGTPEVGDEIEGYEICRENKRLSENVYAMEKACGQKVGTETTGECAVEVKCETTKSLRDEMDPHSCFFKVSSAGPDLEALLNDESAFSQLFPRDEEMIRKKCARVYRKRNKKQNLDHTLSLVNVCPVLDMSMETNSNTDQEFVKLRDSCKYETISIDDAIMLDMCQNHKTNFKKDFDTIGYTADRGNPQRNAFEDNVELDVGELPSQTNGAICRTVTEWNGSKALVDVAEMAQSSDTQMAFKSEDIPTTSPPQLSHCSSPRSSELCAQDSPSNFQKIDIQNLSTKFQLPEIPVFEPSNDVPVVVPITNEGIAVSLNMGSDRRPAERRGRKRIEGGLKLKDKQYKCKVCFTWFLTLGELNFHKLSHNPSPPPTCYMCVQRKFSSREQLRDHLREKHAKNKAGIWTCGMCLKEISDVWMYNEHLREHATQFARKGQTQSSILGLPGCFMQEAAVKNFITSIMQRRPSKSMRGDTGKASLQEAGKMAKENMEQEPKAKGSDEIRGVETKVESAGGGKQSPPSIQEAITKAEASQKNPEMHPNCKDPSRDCHHCGKQFPKPFKLQRHLVVHSLQKIFLCHMCPIFYQEVKELKDHLKSEHQEMEEVDSKHTTLYTCELCADVMHVIKKSFICSTCNYTFSKKEQFDRHMEKHLTGGNQVFKFRGVIRPRKPLSSKDGQFELPPSKRKKIVTESLLETICDNSIDGISSLKFQQSTEVQVSRSTLPLVPDFTASTPGHMDTSIKTEDNTEDFSEILSELEPPQRFVVSEATCLSTAVPKTEKTELLPTLGMPPTVENYMVRDREIRSQPETGAIKAENLTCSQNNTKTPLQDLKDCSQHQTSFLKDYRVTADASDSNVCRRQSSHEDIRPTDVLCLPEHISSAGAVDGPDYICSTNAVDSSKDNAPAGVTDPNVHIPPATASEPPQTVTRALAPEPPKDNTQTSEVDPPMAHLDSTLASTSAILEKVETFHSAESTKELFINVPTNFIKISEPMHDVLQCATGVRQRTVDCEMKLTGVKETKLHLSDFQRNESELKDLRDLNSIESKRPRISESVKRGLEGTLRPASGSQEAANTTTNQKQKRRKELKTYPIAKLSASMTRENMDLAIRSTKKTPALTPSEFESVGGHRKADAVSEYPVLSSVRDDLACNKIFPKLKSGFLNQPPKRNSFESYPLKKAENTRHSNGEYKGKKGVSKRPLQCPTSKAPVNKYRSLSGVRSMESHSFRTAESQNHLLSQLFGQKLTSFKIPLRKDTSESLN